MMKYLLIAAIFGYVIYRLAKPLLLKILQNTSSVHSKEESGRIHVDKKNIVDADFEDINDNKED